LETQAISDTILATSPDVIKSAIDIRKSHRPPWQPEMLAGRARPASTKQHEISEYRLVRKTRKQGELCNGHHRRRLAHLAGAHA
jgi:hypothetical protein